MDQGEEKVGDEGLVKKLRAQARKIHRRALIMAVLLTLAALVYPSRF